MSKLGEITAFMRDMMQYNSSMAMKLDDLYKAKNEELSKAVGKKRKELLAVVAQLTKEANEHMMYASFAESLVEMCQEIGELKGIDVDKEASKFKIKQKEQYDKAEKELKSRQKKEKKK